LVAAQPITITFAAGSDLVRKIALVVLGAATMARFYVRGAILMRAENLINRRGVDSIVKSP